MHRVIEKSGVLTAVIGLILLACYGVPAQHEHHMMTEPTEKTEQKDKPEKPGQENKESKPEQKEKPENQTPSVSLAELERLALANNPTLKQAEFSVRAAEGSKIQAGLLPNPIVGIAAEDLSFRNFGDSGKVSFFIEQKIPLGGKLSKSRRVFEQDVKLAESESSAQRMRVLNTVRLLYAEALSAQTIADLKKETAKLATDSVGVTGELYNVGLADQPDRFKAEINQKRAEAEYFEALSSYEESWQKLAAATGKPELQLARLAGNMPDFLGTVNAEELLATLLAESPEIKAARIKAERAKLALTRARAEKIPDLYLRGGIGYNNELIERAGGFKRAGAQGFLEAGVSLPIFNRNQGGIKTAEAEAAIAEREVERLELVLRTRYAEVLKNYRTAVFRADRYRTEIVPKAKAAYEMYAVNFQNMTAAYTNVLSTHAAYLQAQIEYAQNLLAAQKSLILLKGFLLSGGLNAPLENQQSEIVRNSAVSPVNGNEEKD
jgi:cobalt-zinc-cadmium efflux system outer membrane protein